MTNRELYIKVNQDLGKKYMIGLHNIVKESYVFKSKFDNDKFYMDSESVTEGDIVDSILHKGLYVPEMSVGLSSTVFFPTRITFNTFDYVYESGFNLGKGKTYVIVVAIPKYIYLNGKKCCISSMIQDVGFVNYSLFNSLLPKELIYGYYVKNVGSKIDFHCNEKFYGNMSDLEKECFWLDYFESINLSIDVLDNVFSENIFDIFRKKFSIRKNRMVRQRTKNK